MKRRTFLKFLSYVLPAALVAPLSLAENEETILIEPFFANINGEPNPWAREGIAKIDYVYDSKKSLIGIVKRDGWPDGYVYLEHVR